jgi:hypothetical protein
LDDTKHLIPPMKNIFYPFIAAVVLSVAPAGRAGTYNVGAVGLNTNTGYYLLADESWNVTGGIRVGYFSQSESQIKALIDGWSDTAVFNNTDGTITHYSKATYGHYTNLLSCFTEIGTGGNAGSVVAGWTFSTNGTVAGTSGSVSTTVVPSGSQLYVWAFNILSFTASDFTDTTQWGLFTGEANWLAPGSGTKSLNLAQVGPSGTLIGTDLGARTGSTNTNSVSLVSAAAVVPEPCTHAMLLLGASLVAGMWFLRRPKKALRIASSGT